MPSAPQNPQTQLSRPGAKYAVIVGESGANSTGTAEEIEYLRVKRISRRTGGKDECVFEYDLGKTGERLKDLKTPTKFNRPVEVRLLGEEESLDAALPLFWGDISTQHITLSSDGESATITAKLEPHLFGDVLQGYTAYDVDGKANVTIDDDMMFNPKIDAATKANRSHRREDNDAGTGPYVFLDPEALRSATAKTYQGATAGASKWSLADATEVLCATLNSAETFVANPSVTGQPEFDDAPAPDNIRLKRGEYLPDYLDALFPKHGLDWFVALSLKNFDPDDNESALVIHLSILPYGLGKGVKKEIYWQDIGETLDVEKQNVAELSLETDIGSLANEVICSGSKKEWEVTLELYRAWPDADDALEADDLRKNKNSAPDSQYDSKPDAWRRWVGNEGGDYNGLRTTVKPIPNAPPNLSAPFEFDFAPARRMKLGDRLSTDSSGNREPPLLQYHVSANIWWDIPPEWEGGGYRILKDQIGVLFTGDAPPAELIGFGNDARLRITGTLSDNTRLEASTSSTDSPNARTVTMFLDVSDRFHFRESVSTGDPLVDWVGHDVNGVQTNFSSMTLGQLTGVGQHDDSAKIAEYAVKTLANEDAAVMSASITLHGIHANYEISDLITKIAGREISFNRKSDTSSTKRYLQVTGVDWDFEAQTTVLQVKPVDAFVE